MILRFPAKDLLPIVQHTLAATKWKPSWGVETTEPTLWLVGDQGVYLMSAADPGDNISLTGGISLRVVHANGLNPLIDDLDDWYNRKVSAFGGDDFVQQIGADWLKIIKSDLDDGCSEIRIGLTKKHMTLLGCRA